MNSSYASWARYDVDDALAQVDQLEQQEQIARQKQQKVAAKRRVEDTISQDAEQSAEVLAAHAAVAALKAKAKARSRGGNSKTTAPAASETRPEALLADTDTQQQANNLEDPGSNDDEVEAAAAVLRTRAALMQQKHVLIKATMDARRRGDALLEVTAGACDWEAAKGAYENALASAKTLEAIAPQLLALQKPQETSAIVKGGNQHQHDHTDQKNEKDGPHSSHSHECCDSHDHNHDHTSCGSHPSTPKKKVVAELLPQKDDISAVVKMFLKDCYLGIGACEMGTQHYAAASEAFKEVLLRDESHLLAWLSRGRAFERLDAPLLAWLHYNRVTSLDPAFEDAQECEERIKAALMSGAGEKTPAEKNESSALKTILCDVKLSMDAGNVIMIEGFFAYAISKYENAVELLSVLRAHHALSVSQESLVTKLETTCHVNITSCYLEMQKQFSVALKHCQLALDNDPGHIVANYRLAQVHRAMHAYDLALESYHTVRMLATYLPPHDAEKQLKKLDDEVDKCQFDRSQYDGAFIRQQLQKEATA